ncbi:hypothetical protein CQY21_16835 [Mycolicibacterium boenickei]|nr:hypothetical protein CQY21_16835 [Mycolicibacterium boenickei]
MPPVTVAAVGACPLVPVTPADCGASSVEADRAVDADDWPAPTFAVGPFDVDDPPAPTLAFGPVDAFGPVTPPPEFFAPPPRWLPTLALWSDFFFLSL